MPELIEVETYRRQADAVVGRRIVAAPVLDPLGLRGAAPEAVRAELVGLRIEATDRIGKLLLLSTDGPTIGLRFGMTGRLLVDGDADIERLEYGGQGDDPAWDRYVLAFDRGELRLRDPRRLGGLALDPDIDRLGPDAAAITADELGGAIVGSTVALKAACSTSGGSPASGTSSWTRRSGVPGSTPGGPAPSLPPTRWSSWRPPSGRRSPS